MVARQRIARLIPELKKDLLFAALGFGLGYMVHLIISSI